MNDDHENDEQHVLRFEPLDEQYFLIQTICCLCEHINNNTKILLEFLINVLNIFTYFFFLMFYLTPPQ